MKRLLLLSMSFALLMGGCKDDESPPYNPCEGWGPQSISLHAYQANFEEYDAFKYDTVLPFDTPAHTFEAIGCDCDTFEWRFGGEPQSRYGRRVEIGFGFEVSNLDVTFICHAKGNRPPGCISDYPGRDTVKAVVHILDRGESLIWGTWSGYSSERPDSLIQVVIVHDSIHCPGSPQHDVYPTWVLGLPLAYYQGDCPNLLCYGMPYFLSGNRAFAIPPSMDVGGLAMYPQGNCYVTVRDSLSWGWVPLNQPDSIYIRLIYQKQVDDVWHIDTVFFSGSRL